MTKLKLDDGTHRITVIKSLTRGNHAYTVNREYIKMDGTVIHLGSLACWDKHAVYAEVARLTKHYKMTYKRKLNKWFDDL